MIAPRTPRRSISARPAAAVPPGDVTIRRRSRAGDVLGRKELSRPADRREDEPAGALVGEARDDACILERLDDEAEERRPRARERRGRVEEPLLERHDLAEQREAREHGLLGGGVREPARRERERPGADPHADVRHEAEDGGVDVQDRLERRRAHPGGHRCDRLLRRDQVGHLAQHALDVDRLHAQDDDVGLPYQVGVRLDVADAETLGQRGRAAGAAIGDEDALGHRLVGADPAGHHRGGHVARPEQADDGGALAHGRESVSGTDGPGRGLTARGCRPRVSTG